MAKEQKKEENLEEKQDVRQLRHSFRMAIAGLLLLVLVATGTTYAWFSLSGRASTYVTPMGGTISEGTTSLLISKNLPAHLIRLVNWHTQEIRIR